MEWQPIETAPKSRLLGQILTYRKNLPKGHTIGGVDANWWQTSFWSEKHGLWVGWPLNVQPTHWMPLPPPPCGDDSKG